MIRKLCFTLSFAVALFYVGYAAEDAPIFKVYGDSPVLENGKPGSWNATYTDPGAVVFADGLFHMFYNGFNAWPASVQIGYATSSDGLHWTKQGAEPVLKTDQVPFAGVAALASSAVVLEDGTWALYFYTWESYSGQLSGAKGRIGRATALNPTGPWTVDKNPVLIPGPEGSWDDLRVDAPSVIRTDTGFMMYYAGSNKSGEESIGLASSKDGLTWTKREKPVLEKGAEGEWDAPRVHQPRVEKTPEGWVMLYRSVAAGRPVTIALGIATSNDGVTWTRARINPIFTAVNDFGKQGFWYTAFAYHAGTYYAYVEAPPPANPNQTAVYVATYNGRLVP